MNKELMVRMNKEFKKGKKSAQNCIVFEGLFALILAKNWINFISSFENYQEDRYFCSLSIRYVLILNTIKHD